MLDTNTTQLIKQLKRQPRQGMADIFDDIQTKLGGIFSQYKAASMDVARESAFSILKDNAVDLYEKLNVLEKRNLAVQQGFGVSTKRAAQLGHQFDKLASSVNVNSEKLKDYIVGLDKVFVGNTKLFKSSDTTGKALATQIDLLRNKLKLSEEQANNFVKFQLNAGKVANKDDIAKSISKTQQAIADVAAEIGGPDGYEGALAAITAGIGDLSVATTATFGRVPKDLALAVSKANKLGISLEKITSIGSNFLDIEQSIGSELEFQILSGKELLTSDEKSLANEFRKAAIAQDANKQAELYADFLKNFGDDLQDNVYLQQQATQMFGLSADELFGSLATFRANAADVGSTTEAFNKIFSKTSENINKATDSFATQAEAQNKQSQTEIRNDEAQIAYNKEILAKNPNEYVTAVEKLASMSKDYQAGLLAFGSDITNKLANSEFMKNLAGAGGVAVTVKALYDAVTGGKSGGSIESNTPPAPAKNDLFIPAGGSGTVISGPYGSFSMNPGDDILAAPNIRQATGGGSDTSAIISALQGMSFHVTNVLDGDKIQSSLSIRQGQTLNNINQV